MVRTGMPSSVFNWLRFSPFIVTSGVFQGIDKNVYDGWTAMKIFTVNVLFSLFTVLLSHSVWMTAIGKLAVCHFDDVSLSLNEAQAQWTGGYLLLTWRREIFSSYFWKQKPILNCSWTNDFISVFVCFSIGSIVCVLLSAILWNIHICILISNIVFARHGHWTIVQFCSLYNINCGISLSNSHTHNS